MTTLRARFDAKWAVDPETGCWVWNASRTNPRRGRGYGRISIGGALYVAHRVAWRLFRGPIPTGSRVLHNCDNPPCVNPEHLFLGTQADNISDAASKGRLVPPTRPRESAPRGERSPQAKLTTSHVIAIRASTRSHSALAREFHVTPQAIAAVRGRRTWRHIT